MVLWNNNICYVLCHGSAQVFSRQGVSGLACSRHLGSQMREGERLSQDVPDVLYAPMLQTPAVNLEWKSSVGQCICYLLISRRGDSN